MPSGAESRVGSNMARGTVGLRLLPAPVPYLRLAAAPPRRALHRARLANSFQPAQQLLPPVGNAAALQLQLRLALPAAGA